MRHAHRFPDSLTGSGARRGRFILAGIAIAATASPFSRAAESQRQASPVQDPAIISAVQSARARLVQAGLTVAGENGVTMPQRLVDVTPRPPGADVPPTESVLVAFQGLIRHRTGKVSDLTALACTHPNQGFEKAVLSAARRWVYAPPLKDREPLDAWATFVFEFVPFRTEPPISPGTCLSSDGCAYVCEECISRGGRANPSGDPLSDRTEPRKLTDVAPQYPKTARLLGIPASVTLKAIVTKTGTVANIRLVSCTRPGLGFERAFALSVEQWTYEPATFDGRPVDVEYTIIGGFRLER